jgi:hypothetical protein
LIRECVAQATVSVELAGCDTPVSLVTSPAALTTGAHRIGGIRTIRFRSAAPAPLCVRCVRSPY